MNSIRFLSILTALLLVCPAYLHAADNDTTATSGESEVILDDATESGPDGESAEIPDEAISPSRFSMPTLKDLAMDIKSLQSGVSDSDYLNVMKALGISSDKDINSLFEKFRAYDTEVNKNGMSTMTKLVESKYKNGLKTFGPIQKKESDTFVIFYPEKMTVLEKGKPVNKNTEETLNISSLLSDCATAYEKAAQNIFMNRFINWAGKVRATIFVIVSPDDWRSIRSGIAKSQPVQIVLTTDGSREFFVYAGPTMYEYSSKGLQYAIAELVTREYSKVVARERESKLPDFFITGLAVKASDLDSVLTESGPAQLEKWGNKPVTPLMLKALADKFKSGKSEFAQMPLSKRYLIPLDSMVGPDSYPKSSEKMYYYIRQSSALVDYLNQNGPLAFLTLANSLSDGDRFEKAFDDAYVAVRDQLSGKTAASSSSNDRKRDKSSRQRKEEEKKLKENADDILTGYKELRRGAEDVIFMPLTFEYIQATRSEKSSKPAAPDAPAAPVAPANRIPRHPGL